jgi:hypothetical protein
MEKSHLKLPFFIKIVTNSIFSEEILAAAAHDSTCAQSERFLNGVLGKICLNHDFQMIQGLT